MKTRKTDNTQLKFRFEKNRNCQTASSVALHEARTVQFNPKAELYKKILKRK